MNENLEAQAARFEKMVLELEKAVAHAKTAAAHFRSGEVPRGCAHAVALEGHLFNIENLVRDVALFHSTQANP